MTVRDIVLWPDPRLKTVCTPVAQVDAATRVLVSDMLETMYAAPGRGLAAPQVGALVRIFVMDVDWKEGARAPVVCINPEIESESDDVATRGEGCLSIPGITLEISRPAAVTLSWTDLDGVRRSDVFTEFAAACVQHELDHLNGIVTFNHLSPQNRADMEAEYAEVTP